MAGMNERRALQPATVEFLLSPRGEAVLAELAARPVGDADLLPTLTWLRRSLTAEEAGAALALAQLRRQAAAKFPQPAALYLTATALEQATAAPIAAQRAAWLDQWAPPGPVLDLGCGIGGDLLALAQRRPVIAYETDPVCARFAAANAAALGLAERVEVRNRDWTVDLAAGKLPPVAAAFADPARRVDGRRVFHLDQLTPPFAALLALRSSVREIGVKVMPGIGDDEIPPGWGVEFVSHDGVCKEAVLWHGAAARWPRWATVLGGDALFTAVADSTPPPVGTLHAGQVLYEPDPALIRAHALGELCTQLGAQLFDSQIAYLVAEAYSPTPLAQAFRVEEIHPFHLGRLNARLEALGVAQVELKKRGFPAAPESLRPKLRLAQTGRAATVIFTRRGDARLMLICRRLPGR
jgi:SAM-dependent methyltransferase